MGDTQDNRGKGVRGSRFIERRMPREKPSYTNYDQTERRARDAPAPVTLVTLRFMGGTDGRPARPNREAETGDNTQP